MHQEEFSFLSLLLITALAAFVPLLASRLKRIRVPIVVGEIIAGMIVGKSGLNLIEPSPALEFLTIFGFTYLMFISGLEVDFGIIMANNDRPKQRRPLSNPIILGTAIFALTILLAFIAAEIMLLLGWVTDPFIIALILSTTSLGIVVPVLKERGMMGTSYGQALLMSALVADFGTLVLITVDVTIISRGLTFEVLLVLLLLVAFAVAVQVGRWVARIPGLPRVLEELSHATAQIKVRGAVALMVAFIVLSEWLGSEIILGAFLAGAAISLLAGREGALLQEKVDAIGFGFFIPIFFIMVGVQFDLPALLSSPQGLLLVPVLLGVSYLVKFLSALLFRLHFTWRQTFAAGGLLSARLSLIIAAAAIALDLGIIDEAFNADIILIAIMTCTFSPLIFNRIIPAQPEAERHGVILVGLGEITSMLTSRSHQIDGEITVVGRTEEPDKRGDRIRNRGVPVIIGDPGDENVLRKAGADTASALIAMSSYDQVNLDACMTAHEKFDVPHLIALTSNPQTADKLNELGVRVVQPQMATVQAIEGALHFPAAFDMLTNHQDGVDVREIELNDRRWKGKRLRDIMLPGDALILGMRRKGEVLIPDGNTRLQTGDLLMLVGHHDALSKAITKLNNS
jgi:Kef-type K+ transport system membrane component KefB/Trk K+ transport system NAD-binding subunit